MVFTVKGPAQMFKRIGNTTCKWVNLDPPRLLRRQERLLKREIIDPRSVLSQNQHLEKMRSRRLLTSAKQTLSEPTALLAHLFPKALATVSSKLVAPSVLHQQRV